MEQLYTDALQSTMTTTIETKKLDDGTWEATNGAFTAKSTSQEDAIEKLSTAIQVAVKTGEYYPGME